MVYNARLKFQRDEVARLKAIIETTEVARKEAMEEGRQEGEEIGKAVGRQMGRIAVLQELLGQRVWMAEEIAAYDAAQLSTIAEQLQQQLQARHS